MKIKVVDELPQWIISSDKAAYTPHNKTIWLRRDCKRYIFHELGHWLIDLFTKNPKIHKRYDELCTGIQKEGK